MKNRKPLPLTIAHRGYSGKFAENSLSAFQAASQCQAQMIELDIHLTIDNELIVMHDFQVEQIPYSPKLADVFTAVKNIPLNIEIKNETLGQLEHYQIIARKLLELLDIKDPQKQSIISSFDLKALEIVRQKSISCKLGILDHHPQQSLKIPAAKKLAAYSYHPNWENLSKEHVSALHQKNLQVFSYTANKIEEFQKLFDLNVNGIITNEVELLNSFKSKK